MDSTAVQLTYDVIDGTLPPGILLDARQGRMFRIVELTDDERHAVYDATPNIDEREAIVSGVSGRAARELCTALRGRHDAVAATVAKALDDPPRRYAVRPSSVEDTMAANGIERGPC